MSRRPAHVTRKRLSRSPHSGAVYSSRRSSRRTISGHARRSTTSSRRVSQRTKSVRRSKSRRLYISSIRSRLKLGFVLVASVLFLGSYLFVKRLNTASIYADSSLLSDTASTSLDSSLLPYVLFFGTLENDLEHVPYKFTKITVLVLRPGTNASFLIDFDPSLKVSLPGDSGVDSLSNVLAVGTLPSLASTDSCDSTCLVSGMGYVQDVFQHLIGAPISHWVISTSEFSSKSQDMFLEGKLSALLGHNWLKRSSTLLATDMSSTELLHHFSLLRILDHSMRHSLAVNASIDYVSLIDSGLRELNFNAPVAQEKLAVAVLNGTDMSGVASFGARVVRNAGGHVVSVDNASRTTDKSYIITDVPTSATVTLLRAFFPDALVISRDMSPFTDSQVDRADVTLVLGLDFLPHY